MRHIHRNSVKAEVDCPCQLMHLILRDLGYGSLSGETPLGNKSLIQLHHIGDAQTNGIILLASVCPLIFKALAGFGIAIPISSTTAVFSKAALDIFLILGSAMWIAEVRIYSQLALCLSAEEEVIDFILSDKHLTLPQKVRLSHKAAFGVFYAIQNTLDSVSIIRRDAKTHNFMVFLMGL